jgi:uncharacterized pyridoxal phosphate-containing UPF0001 family protein
MEMENEREGQGQEPAGEAAGTPPAEIHSEADLQEKGEHAAELHEAEAQQQDYASLSRKQLAELAKSLVAEPDGRKVDPVVKAARAAYEELRDRRRQEARDKFIAEGGNAADFSYKPDDDDLVFDGALKVLRDRKANLVKSQEEQKNLNYGRKLELLEKLRALVDGEDQEKTFEAFKALQKEWKSTGAVPLIHNREVWANYTALVNRYYDNRSIYFELKELDRRKNLEAKVELCARAEKLLTLDRIWPAVHELNELHHEFKHIGPVPKEEQEKVWQRFKAASDAIYKQREIHLEEIREKLKGNFELRNRLAEEVQAFAAFASDRIKEWNQKSKELVELQKKWESVGPVPRNKARDVNRKFWGSIKSFFHNKSGFFHKLDEGRKANLTLKQELIQKANELKDSSDWSKAAQEIKNLQARWKEIGPVPEKISNKVFREFKEACDHFFNQRRNQVEMAEKEQEANLAEKVKVVEELERISGEKSGSRETLTELQARYNAIGFVPRNAMPSLRERYSKAVAQFINSLDGISESQRMSLKVSNELSSLKGDPNGEKKIFEKERGIRRRIQQIEDEVAVWKNNLEFFARSKNADGLRTEFNAKIEAAGEQIRKLKGELKALREAVLA